MSRSSAYRLLFFFELVFPRMIKLLVFLFFFFSSRSLSRFLVRQQSNLSDLPHCRRKEPEQPLEGSLMV